MYSALVWSDACNFVSSTAAVWVPASRPGTGDVQVHPAVGGAGARRADAGPAVQERLAASAVAAELLATPACRACRAAGGIPAPRGWKRGIAGLASTR